MLGCIVQRVDVLEGIPVPAECTLHVQCIALNPQNQQPFQTSVIWTIVLITGVLMGVSELTFSSIVFITLVPAQAAIQMLPC